MITFNQLFVSNIRSAKLMNTRFSEVSKSCILKMTEEKITQGNHEMVRAPVIMATVVANRM